MNQYQTRLFERLVGYPDPDICWRWQGARVNPAHLEPVTMRENLRRGDSVAALLGRRTHCKRGHRLGGNNILGNRYRECKACHRDRERARRGGITE